MTTDITTLVIKADSTDINKAEKDLSGLVKQSSKTEKRIKTLEKGFNSAGKALKVGLGTAVVATVAAMAKGLTTFAGIEQGLINVQKTADLSEKEMDSFEKRILSTSRTLPVATKELLNISGVAGQLGIKGVDNITKFTVTMGKLQLATDVVGEEGAASIARLLNVTGDGIETVDSFGAVLVALGNNSAATESEILGLGTEIAQATSTFSVSSSEAIALGAAMKSMGVNAELGGSVTGRAMRAIEDAIESGGVKMQKLSKLSGIASEDLKSAFGASATTVFQKWLKGVNEMVASGQTASSVLGEFGLKGEEILKVLPTMAVNVGQVDKALKIANDELERGTALDNEAAKASESLSAQWQTSKNIATEFFNTLGKDLAPTVKELLSSFNNWWEVNDDLIKQDIGRWVDIIAPKFMFLAKTIGNIAQSFAGWSAIAQGRLGFLEFNSMNAEELSKWLERDRLGLVNIGLQLEKLQQKRKGVAESFAFTSEARKAKQAELRSIEAQIKALEKLQQKRKGVAERFAYTSEAKKAKQAELRSIEAQIKALENQEEGIFHLEKVIEENYQDSWINANKEVKKDTVEKQKEVKDNTKNTFDEIDNDLKKFFDGMVVNESNAFAISYKNQMEWSDTYKDILDKNQTYFATYSKSEQNEMNEMKDMWLTNELEKAEATKRGNQTIEESDDNKTDLLKGNVHDVVSAVIAGEDLKVAVSGLATEKLSDFAVEAATTGLSEIFSAIGAQIGAWVGLGTAQSATDGKTWQQKVASGLGYVASAGAAVLAGKAIGDSFAADGAWIANNPMGGVATGGSGYKDDIFAGISGRADGGINRNWIMGGEFVVNKKSTAKHFNALKAINEDRFAEGGPISDPLEITQDINANVFDTFVNEAMKTGNWYSAAAQAAIYGAGTLGAMWAGKLVGPKIFGYADGGQIDGQGTISDQGFGIGDFLKKFLDPFDIVKKSMNWVDKLQKFIDPFGIGQKVMDFAGLYKLMYKLPEYKWVHEALDAALLPFIKDILTPGVYNHSQDTVISSFKGIFKSIGENLKEAFAPKTPLGGFETGTDYVPKTGPYVLHQGEKVIPAKYNNNNDLLKAFEKLIGIVENGNDYTKDIYKIIRYWESKGLPPTRS